MIKADFVQSAQPTDSDVERAKRYIESFTCTTSAIWALIRADKALSEEVADELPHWAQATEKGRDQLLQALDTYCDAEAELM